MPYPPEIDFPGITLLQARGIQVACGAWFGQNSWGDFEGREAAHRDIVAWLANAMDISLEEQQQEGVLV